MKNEADEPYCEAVGRREVTSSRQQCGFMMTKSTADGMFVLRVLMGKHRED